VALDKLDKLGDGVAKEPRDRQLTAAAADTLLRLMAPDTVATIDSRARVAALESTLADDSSAAAGLRDLSEIFRYSEATSARGRIRVDPSLARGLSYYTGAIMEIAVPDLAGSLGGGGRYDGLIGMFLGEDIPACGFSLGLERILVVMSERNMFPPDILGGVTGVMVTLFDGEPIEDALALATELRGAGLRVDVYPEADKLGKQFKYAASRGIRFVIVVGSSEREAKQVTVKNMDTGEQTTVARREIASWLGARLSPEP
jgi:histidyl-tRNA synthetase